MSPPAAGDGLLTAEDVTGLDRLEPDLVVLRWRDGAGSGEGRREGDGLRRAFQLVGTRTVMLSLWKAPDEATRDHTSTK